MSHPRPAESRTDPQAVPTQEKLEQSARDLNARAEPILCRHCGRTASNGISCEGYCVADSGY